ncbi:substrate-binding domain-containing protein [Sporosarcina sp. Marseille-Q4063]|uniref:substrate-binding domain-containing protein n=1 Tax=Sporosarcina sp. Marseille-Q4063 TaxID=2810514 RepID=UPI001BAE88E1|nr:substrate-binding domain-containing protein [Sporosarcina sp. Marseille-Q4063]QUW21338.1 substrate-binding domain-containing protein [Sporosarcina sp. Marseille-Q4063]
MKKVTIDDVAKKARISKSTVSQYLNKRYEYMSVETRERIKETIEELGYQPNIVARSLTQKSTSTIGVIVANILHAFSTQIIRTIEDYCNERDLHIIVCNADDKPEKEKRYIDMLLAKQVDGLIIFPTGGNLDLYERLQKQNYPLVFVDRAVKEIDVSSVMLDNALASELAVNHFVQKGYSRIGILTSEVVRNVSTRIERVAGFKRAMLMNGMEVNEDFIKSVNVERVQEAFHEMFSLEKRPEAIIAGNDLTLFEILKYVNENNIKVPDDLALIGIDDVGFASIYSPPLTTIAQPTVEMGKKAASLLVKKINKDTDEAYKSEYRFEPKLIARDSC